MSSTAISIASIIISILAILITVISYRRTTRNGTHVSSATTMRTYGGYPAGSKTASEMSPPPGRRRQDGYVEILLRGGPLDGKYRVVEPFATIHSEPVDGRLAHYHVDTGRKRGQYMPGQR